MIGSRKGLSFKRLISFILKLFGGPSLRAGTFRCIAKQSSQPINQQTRVGHSSRASAAPVLSGVAHSSIVGFPTNTCHVLREAHDLTRVAVFVVVPDIEHHILAIAMDDGGFAVKDGAAGVAHDVAGN